MFFVLTIEGAGRSKCPWVLFREWTRFEDEHILTLPSVGDQPDRGLTLQLPLLRV
jgi:hypothetical protein